MDYSDELFAGAIGTLRDATCHLADVAATIDMAEPIRVRLDAQVSDLDRALDELDRILDDARNELL